jgi:tetratricopeptide (TPR) repeat protein
VAENDLGFVFIKMDQPDSAIAVLEPATQLFRDNPDSRYIWKNLGLAKLLTHDLVGAEQAFQKALDIHPDYAPAEAGMAMVLEERGETEAALSKWQTLESSRDTTVASEAVAAVKRLQETP